MNESKGFVSGFIPDNQWEGWDELDSLGRLISSITVNGCPMHIEAWEVGDDNGQQRAKRNGLLDQIKNAVAAPGAEFETITMRGRSFVLIATPFALGQE